MAELPLTLYFDLPENPLPERQLLTLQTWAAAAREHFFTQLVAPEPGLAPRSNGLRCQAEHPLTGPDRISLILSIATYAPASLTLRMVFWSEVQARTVAELRETLIPVDRAGQSRPWPEVVRTRMQELHFEQNWSED